ncbi:MAG: NAD(P)-dependent oxidoreductase [Planctomycetes bacterium]|nr:NAD(P)-dependent oxidoreductase [Planctomycetota bacterium]
MPPLARTDLDHILDHTRDLWDEARGKRFFLTGGTGFVGCWLLESFAWANDKLGLNSSALVLTRNYEAFKEKAPHLANHPAIAFHPGDVRSFEFPGGQFAFIIHGAAESSTNLNNEDPLAMFDVIVQGTRLVLDFAGRAGTKKMLFISSGAVYGKQPGNMTHVPEEYQGAPDTTDPASAYAEGKRAGELLCSLYARSTGLQAKIARCFAFVGPYLPLDAHFAIGNFIRDGLRGEPIKVKGDGTPYRSYLYAADLAVWLWTILFRGESCVPYNVGSEHDLSIADLAGKVSSCFPQPIRVHVAEKPVPGAPAERYVPSVRRAFKDLGLGQTTQLEQAVRNTIDWQTARERVDASGLAKGA